MKLVGGVLLALSLCSAVAFAEDKAWQADCVAAEKNDPGANSPNSAGGTNVQAFCKCIDSKTDEGAPDYATFKKSAKYPALEEACAKAVGWTE